MTNKKSLGFWRLLSLVVGNVIGSGIFLLPAALASIGSISLFSWAITSVGAILLAIVFGRMGNILPKIGGPYAYCRAAFGDFVGFQMAYNYWIALWVGNSAIIVAFIGYLSDFWPQLAHNHLLSYFVSIGIVWSITMINVLGVRQAGIVQLITTFLKLIPLLAIASIGLLFVKVENFSTFNITGHSNLSAFTMAASLTLWSFIGLESGTIPAGDIENPKRNIPRATIWGTAIAAVIYILSTIAVMGVVPLTQLAQSNAPFAAAAKIMFGNWAEWVVALGAIISCFGAANGWILLQGQVPRAAAEDGLFPQAFAKMNKHGTPAFGLIVSSTLITILLGLNYSAGLVAQFKLIIQLAVLASLIPYLYTTMAYLIICMRDRTKLEGRKLANAATVAILAGAYATWTIVGSGKAIVFYGSLLFFSSVPVYAWICWRNENNNNVATI